MYRVHPEKDICGKKKRDEKEERLASAECLFLILLCFIIASTSKHN